MPLADRRLASRFDVVGDPWGTLDALEPMRVCNLAPEGMLVESQTPLALGSVHQFELASDTVTVFVRAAVRHLSPERRPGAAPSFLVGLEFLHLDARTSAEIEHLIHEQAMRPSRKEA